MSKTNAFPEAKTLEEALRESELAKSDYETAMARHQWYTAQAARLERLKRPRTELTREHLLQWAASVVAGNPKRIARSDEIDPKKPGYHKRIKIPTTIPFVLATVCQAIDQVAFGEVDRDTVLTIWDWMWHGLTANKDQTEEESMVRILEYAKDVLEDIASLEDLLEDIEWSPSRLEQEAE